MKTILIGLFVVGAAFSSMAQSAPEHFVNYNLIEKTNRVEIYPNPTIDYLNIEIENSNLVNPKIEVYNIIGNRVEINLETLDANKYRIDVRDLPAGYYLVTIKDDDVLLKDMFKFLKR